MKSLPRIGKISRDNLSASSDYPAGITMDDAAYTLDAARSIIELTETYYGLILRRAFREKKEKKKGKKKNPSLYPPRYFYGYSVLSVP